MAPGATKDQLWNLYQTHRRELYAYALSITRNSVLAEDAIVEVARGNGHIRNLRAYVFRVVRNAALRQQRTVQSSQPLKPKAFESFLVIPEHQGPDDLCQERERNLLLAKALEQIPFEQKETIVLRIYAGLKFREISETLGKPLSSITSRYRRGLEALAERLEEHDHGP